jgi:hypothetical protein
MVDPMGILTDLRRDFFRSWGARPQREKAARQAGPGGGQPPGSVLRAFPQAPWRSQIQTAATFLVVLLPIVVVAGFYLHVASRAATAGRDVQQLEADKARLIRENDELQAELAALRSVTRLAARATELGFKPAAPEQIEYLSVADYPHNAQTSPLPRAAVPPAPTGSPVAQGLDWLAQAVQAVQSLVGAVRLVP